MKCDFESLPLPLGAKIVYEVAIRSAGGGAFLTASASGILPLASIASILLYYTHQPARFSLSGAGSQPQGWGPRSYKGT